MAWRLARSLDVLRGEVRARSPQTTIYDIDDTRELDSDHDPNAANVVCAIDIMQGHGLNLGALAEEIRARRHPAGKYVIYNRRIASANRGWEWRDYTGRNPHTDHIHVSVGVGWDGHSTGPYDDPSPWLAGGGIILFCKFGDSGQPVEALQRVIVACGGAVGTRDGKPDFDGRYGDNTAKGLAALVGGDGKTYGPAQYAALLARLAAKYAGRPGPAGPAGPAGPPGRDGRNGEDGQDAVLEDGAVLVVQTLG